MKELDMEFLIRESQYSDTYALNSSFFMYLESLDQ